MTKNSAKQIRSAASICLVIRVFIRPLAFVRSVAEDDQNGCRTLDDVANTAHLSRRIARQRFREPWPNLTCGIGVDWPAPGRGAGETHSPRPAGGRLTERRARTLGVWRLVGPGARA